MQQWLRRLHIAINRRFKCCSSVQFREKPWGSGSAIEDVKETEYRMCRISNLSVISFSLFYYEIRWKSHKYDSRSVSYGGEGKNPCLWKEPRSDQLFVAREVMAFLLKSLRFFCGPIDTLILVRGKNACHGQSVFISSLNQFMSA